VVRPSGIPEASRANFAADLSAHCHMTDGRYLTWKRVKRTLPIEESEARGGARTLTFHLIRAIARHSPRGEPVVSMAAERPGKRACLDTFLFTSESVGEGHPSQPRVASPSPSISKVFCAECVPLSTRLSSEAQEPFARRLQDM
jgi:hypothetical protein